MPKTTIDIIHTTVAFTINAAIEITNNGYIIANVNSIN